MTDPQGLPVGNVTVTASSPTMQGTRATTTAADGTYTFLQLPVGTYELTFETSSVLAREAHDQHSARSDRRTERAAADGRCDRTGPGGRRRYRRPSPRRSLAPTFKHDEIDALPTPRTLAGITQLAPGLTENTPNAGQVTINGAFAFDNVFMINGVDVNDNLFGSPQNLFIEDAIEETQVLTSGITAEYGRFTGGVVNAVTKSGGNTFSRQLPHQSFESVLDQRRRRSRVRSGVTAASCRRGRAPRQDADDLRGHVRRSDRQDRLWFFGAGRDYARPPRPARCRDRTSRTTDGYQQARGHQAHRDADVESHASEAAI